MSTVSEQVLFAKNLYEAVTARNEFPRRISRDFETFTAINQNVDDNRATHDKLGDDAEVLWKKFADEVSDKRAIVVRLREEGENKIGDFIAFVFRVREGWPSRLFRSS